MPFDRRSPRWHALYLCIAVCVACKPAPRAAAPDPAVPKISATVVDIRTTIEPEKKTWNHSVIVAGDRARSTAERDSWRLFDTKARTVTFVDDVAKTVRTEPFAAIAGRRVENNGSGLPDHYPDADLVRSSERRTMQGVIAEKVTIESGAYRRELWMAEHPSIPRGLFAMMHGSEPRASPLAPMMRGVDDGIAAMRGFPLLDRSAVPVGDREIVIERTVTAIAQREVAESLLTIPRDYRDLTPKPAATK